MQHTHKKKTQKDTRKNTDNSRQTKTSQQLRRTRSSRLKGEQESTVKGRLGYTIMYSPVFIKGNFNQFEGANTIKY